MQYIVRYTSTFVCILNENGSCLSITLYKLMMRTYILNTLTCCIFVKRKMICKQNANDPAKIYNFRGKKDEHAKLDKDKAMLSLCISNSYKYSWFF